MHSWKLMVGIWVVLFSLSTVKIQAQIFQNDYQYITIAELLPDTMDGWIWDDSLGKVEFNNWSLNTSLKDTFFEHQTTQPQNENSKRYYNAFASYHEHCKRCTSLPCIIAN